MSKPRILWCAEASFLHTGYAIYTREVLNRLYATGKYEIAEFSSFGATDTTDSTGIPWSYYGNLPCNESEQAEYLSVPTNQFGEWRFEDVCLDFKPDIVCDIRDWWMLHHEYKSCFRPFYHWMIMPAIDSDPMQNEWLNSYAHADNIFAYSEYGKEAVEKQTSIKIHDVCPPSANPSAFFPVENKALHKSEMGFVDDINIIGTVMRNQKRKLYPDLIQSFKIFHDSYPELAKNTYLYLHVSYPDVGWDIPRLIYESGISSKILLTYSCGRCGKSFPGFFVSSTVECPDCKTRSASIPNAQMAINERDLAKIINCFDLYVQYSICEGFGMPQVEAAYCGVPVMSVDYSAMSSVVRSIEGEPIKCSLFREMETHTYRAQPDNHDFVNKLAKFMSLPKSVRMKRGHDTFQKATEQYTWDKTAKKWEEWIDKVDIRDHSDTWDSESAEFIPPSELPDLSLMSNDEYIKWAIVNVLGQPEKVSTLFHLQLLQNLNDGYSFNAKVKPDGRKGMSVFSRNDVLNILYELRYKYNMWEDRRVNGYQKPEFITKAKI